MSKFVIGRELLEQLFEDRLSMDRLAKAGVDNWEGMDFAFEGFDLDKELKEALEHFIKVGLVEKYEA